MNPQWWIIFAVLFGYIVLVAIQRYNAAAWTPSSIAITRYETHAATIKSGDLVMFCVNPGNAISRVVLGSHLAHPGIAYVNPQLPALKYMLHLAFGRVKLHPIEHVFAKESKRGFGLAFRSLDNPLSDAQAAKFQAVIDSPYTDFERRDPHTGTELPAHRNPRTNQFVNAITNEKLTWLESAVAQGISTHSCLVNHLTPFRMNVENTALCIDYVVKILLQIGVLEDHPYLRTNCLDPSILHAESTPNLNQFMSSNSYSTREFHSLL